MEQSGILVLGGFVVASILSLGIVRVVFPTAFSLFAYAIIGLLCALTIYVIPPPPPEVHKFPYNFLLLCATVVLVPVAFAMVRMIAREEGPGLNHGIREPPRGGVLSLAGIPEARRTDPLRYSDIEAGEDVVRSRVGTDAQGQPIYVYMDSTMWRDAMDVGFQGARQYLHPVTRGVVQPDQVSRHTLVARKRHRRKQTPKKK